MLFHLSASCNTFPVRVAIPAGACEYHRDTSHSANCHSKPHMLSVVHVRLPGPPVTIAGSTTEERAKIMPAIIVAGLGPGAWEQVTLEVKNLLDSASTIYLRTKTHPTA